MCIDHTEVDKQMYIIYGFKTLKLIIFILGSSYFIGIFWYIMCDLYNRYHFEHFDKGIPFFFQNQYFTDYDESVEVFKEATLNGTLLRCSNIP